MTGENAKTPVCHFPESLDLSALPPDVTSALCVVPRLFEQARWCTRTSPCSSSPRRRGSIWGAKCRMAMDSRLRGNDEWRCGREKGIGGRDNGKGELAGGIAGLKRGYGGYEGGGGGKGVLDA